MTSRLKQDASVLTITQPGGSPENGPPTGAILQYIDGKQIDISQQLAEYAGRRKSLLTKLFPTKLDVVLMDGQLNQARTAAQFDQRMLALACEIKFKACEEAADTWLKSLKVENRDRFFDFVTAKLIELSKTIENRRQEFGVLIDERYSKADTYAHIPKFQEQYVKSIETEIGDTIIWLDGLLSRFRAIVDEGITNLDQTAIASR